VSRTWKIVLVVLLALLGAAALFVWQQTQSAAPPWPTIEPVECCGAELPPDAVGNEELEGTDPPTDDLAIAAAAAKLVARPVRYNRPERLDYGEFSEIVLIIASDDPDGARRELEALPGPIAGATVKLSNKVRAELIGAPSLVEIAPWSEREGTVYDGRNTEFRWQVRPRTTDEFYLALTIYNQVEANGRQYWLAQPVFSDTFRVNASVWQRAWLFVNSTGGFWTFVGGLSVVLSGLGLLYRKRHAMRWSRPSWKPRPAVDDAKPTPGKKARKRPASKKASTSKRRSE
jgi:hypothetical protein